MNISLLLHNIFAVFSAIVAIGLVLFFTFTNKQKKAGIIAFTGMNLAIAVFYISHLIGVNTADPSLSKSILMLNVSIIFVTTFFVHAGLAVMNKDHERKSILSFFYVVAFILVIFYLIFPDTFLADSASKMYFPNYYEPGQFHWVMRALYNGILPGYILAELIMFFVKARNPIERNRAKYFGVAAVLGYVGGLIPVFLIFNIPIDPIYGILFTPMFSVPLMYAVVNYELVDIKIVAKKAFTYGIVIAVIGAFISFFNLSNKWLEQAVPGFPVWISPIFTSFIAVFFGVLVWKKIRENDILKYEFITTVTHKFRTPLTHIKWAAENLSNATTPEEIKTQINYIQTANTKLVGLTDLLVDTSEAEDKNYTYNLVPMDLSKAVRDIVDNLDEQFMAEKQVITKNIKDNINVAADSMRIKFVIQVLIENAMHYTPKSGTIDIRLDIVEDNAVFSVKDSGIGMRSEDLPLLFSKFYRGKHARAIDTEGMGIGLFISKEIITRHDGRIWAESQGKGLGSTFKFSIPLAK